jgi:hypothetical protein
VSHVAVREIQDSVALIVCGGRDYNDTASIQRTLQMVMAYKRVDVFHGACPTGADAETHRYFQSCRHPNLEIHEFPADWGTYGRRAGPLRNQQMVEAAVKLRSPTCRVVFMAYWDGESRGTLDCMSRAAQAGIEGAVIPPNQMYPSA